jgi:flagellar protein FliO/FliZ
MESSFVIDALKLIVLLPLILLLIYITLKYGGKYMGKLNNGRIIKILERVPMGQNSYLAIVSISGKPYLVSGGEKGIQILKELDESVLKNYENNAVLNNEAFIAQLQKLNLVRRKDEK